MYLLILQADRPFPLRIVFRIICILIIDISLNSNLTHRPYNNSDPLNTYNVLLKSGLTWHLFTFFCVTATASRFNIYLKCTFMK